MLQYFNINFAHLWCTIAPRWFPTKEKRQKRMWSEILLQVQVKKKKRDVSCCCQVKQQNKQKWVAVLEEMGADGHEAANSLCQCLTHSGELWPSWKAGPRLNDWAFQSELPQKEKRKKKRGSRVSDCWSWIEFWQVATGKGPARSPEGVMWVCAHWVLISQVQSIFMLLCTDVTYGKPKQGSRATFEGKTFFLKEVNQLQCRLCNKSSSTNKYFLQPTSTFRDEMNLFYWSEPSLTQEKLRTNWKQHEVIKPT